MLRRPLRLLLLCLLLCLLVAPAAAEDFQITFGDGGDCSLLGGAWSRTTQTCSLVGLSLAPDDQLLIVANANLIGLARNAGTIDTTAELIVSGTLENSGVLRNHGTMRVLDRLNNLEDGYLENRPGSGIVVKPAAVFENNGDFANAGLMFLQVSESPFVRATLLNRAAIINQGTLWGNATQTQVGGLLDNRGSVLNFGTLRNATIENRGEIHGGTVDDDGPAKSTLVNHPSGEINGSTLSGLAFQNFGEMNGVFLGSGTLANEPGGVIRVAGGTSFLMVNQGLIEILAPFEMRNTFINQPGAVVVNESSVTNRALWTNHGLLENRGSWTHQADVAGEGQLNNHGTLINGVTINVCEQAPDLEQLNNFGVLANAGQISSCGSTNSGDWYQCGAGGTPAGLPVIGAVDGDSDAVCAGVDCNDANADAWAAPGEVGRITLNRTAGGSIQYRWNAAAYLGGNSVLYDLLAFEDGADPLGSQICLSSGQSGLAHAESSVVPSGTVQFSLPRAVGCDVGVAGFGSDGVPRQLATCP
jgi:hypothetical protein